MGAQATSSYSIDEMIWGGAGKVLPFFHPPISNLYETCSAWPTFSLFGRTINSILQITHKGKKTIESM